MRAGNAVVQSRPMRHFIRLLAALVLFAPCAPLYAADSSAVRLAVDDFMRSQVLNLPGKVTYSIGAIDADRLPGPCEGFEVSMEGGARAWGRTRVTVSCRGAGWKLWVPVRVRVVADYLVVARPVGAGQILAESDIRVQTGEISELPGAVLTDKAQAVGRTSIAALVPDRPLRADMLRLATVVQAGQSVKVIGTGSGFQVTYEGRALGSAVIGQVVQVRLNSGQILSGVARSDGAVEIRF